MANFLDKFKEVSNVVINKSRSAATDLRDKYGEQANIAVKDLKEKYYEQIHKTALQLWDRYGEEISSAAIEIVKGSVKRYGRWIVDKDLYKTHIVDRLWEMLPMPIRVFGRERLGWDALMMNLRENIFHIEGEEVSVNSDAREKIATALKSMLQHHPAE